MQMVPRESRAYIMKSEPGQRLRSNSNLPSRDTLLHAAMSHHCSGWIHNKSTKEKKTYQHFPHLWTCSIFKKVHVISFIVEKWHRTDQRVNLDRKLVLLVLRHWALMTWQRRRQIGLMLESCGLVKLDYNALKINKHKVTMSWQWS